MHLFDPSSPRDQAIETNTRQAIIQAWQSEPVFFSGHRGDIRNAAMAGKFVSVVAMVELHRHRMPQEVKADLCWARCWRAAAEGRPIPKMACHPETWPALEHPAVVAVKAGETDLVAEFVGALLPENVLQEVLVAACGQGMTDLVRELLEEGIRGEEYDPLFEACAQGQHDVVELLLQAGFKLDFEGHVHLCNTLAHKSMQTLEVVAKNYLAQGKPIPLTAYWPQKAADAVTGLLLAAHLQEKVADRDDAAALALPTAAL